MTKFVDYTLNGVSTGAIYAAVALALVLIWRATRIVNFAQGAMLMITTYIASAVITSTGSYVFGFAVALLAGLVLGALVERILIRRVENAPPLNSVIVTLGLYAFLTAVAGMVWGDTPRSFPNAFSIRGYDIGGTHVLFAPEDTFTVVVVVVVALALWALFRFTSLGLQMRAAAFKPEVAQLLGVRVGRIFTVGWGLAALTGATAGVLVAPSVFLAPNNFDPVLISGFVAAVLGGLDSPLGAVIGSLVLGAGPVVRGRLRGRRARPARGAGDPRRRADDPADRAVLRGQGPARVSALSAFAARTAHGRLAGSTLARALGLVALAAVVLVVASDLLSPYDNTQLASGAYYFAALAGLTVLIGLSGQISLGHGAFMALGAYTVLLLVGNEGWSLFPALVVAAGVAAVVGLPVGAAASRLRGPYLAGATLAFAVGLPAIADKYPATFGGENGLTINPPPVPSWLGASFAIEQWQAWVACAGALVVLFVLYNLTRSGTGRALRAVRDDEIAASLCGLRVGRQQTLAFVISAGCAGLGGGMYAVVLNLATPSAFPLTLSLSLLTGVVVGGLGSLMGAVCGAAVLVLVPSWSTDIANSLSLSANVQSNLPFAIYGVVLIVVMLAWPGGIQGGFQALRARVARTRAESDPSTQRRTP